jgi:ABC-2 type transport system ATP-binding protein
MSVPTIIALDNITMKYGNLIALDQVSFALREGEIFGYIGPNGAGKTTTIKIIVGLIRDFTGSYRAMGRDVENNVSILQAELGYLPQHVAFQDWRTVKHALETFGELSGLKADEIRERTQSLLPLLGLTEVYHKKISELSGGTVQKVGLAQALLHRPKILVLDEPLKGLDPAGRSAVKQLMKEFSQNGTTIFFSSHILSDVRDIADRIGIISGGRMLSIGTITELQAQLTSEIKYEIDISGDIQKAIQGLRLSEGVNISQTDKGRLLLSFEKSADLARIADEILKQLLSMNFHIRCFKPVSVDLDEVFLRYLEETDIK